MSAVIRTVLLYFLVGITSIPFLPLFFLAPDGSEFGRKVLQCYLGMILFLLKYICKVDYVVRGRENLPKVPCILASRHESTWSEAFQYIFDNPAMIIKSEALRYPVVGRIAKMNQHIATDRQGDVGEFQEIVKSAKKQMDAGRSILMFPSGTRRLEHRDRIQGGVAALYRYLNCPCVPIINDAGKCWPYGEWKFYPGTIEVRILPPIPPGLDKREFLKTLKSRLSSVSEPMTSQAGDHASASVSRR